MQGVTSHYPPQALFTRAGMADLDLQVPTPYAFAWIHRPWADAWIPNCRHHVRSSSTWTPRPR